MPLTSQYHPISLYVIRGSLIHCGWTPGRISQLGSNQTLGTARYRIAITKVPKTARDASPKAMKNAINDCFMDDITCTEVWHKSDGSITAYISVDLKKGEPDQLPLPEESFTVENSIDLNALRCSNCNAVFVPGTGERTVFGGWFCNDCLD